MVEIIRELCKQRNTTLKTLEKELNLGNGTIARWDDSSPAVAKVARVAEYFGVSVDFIYSGQEKRPAEAGQRDELIRLFESASPELQAAALAVLRSAESRSKVPGDGQSDL